MTTEDIKALEDQHHSGGRPRRPFNFVRAKGAKLWDDSGKEYIDCAAAQGWANVGHSHPLVTKAIQTQAEQLVAWTESSYTEQRGLWMRDLAALTPGPLKRIHPCNSGAEAIEAALKAARFFTGRPNIITAKRGFHGRTFGAMTATATKSYRDPFAPLVPGFTYVTYNDIEALRETVNEQTAAVLLEVVQGEGGIYPGDLDYFAQVRDLCSEQGTLLIFDEIQTGFGRTGKLFATEHLTILPDMITLGKALGGGIPMGALVWDGSLGTFKAGLHSSTFGGNPLACAASRAVIQVMQSEQLPERAALMGQWFIAELQKMEAKQIREIRGLGLMIGVQLRGRGTKVLKALAGEGVWALPAGPTVLRLLPPLVISQDELEIVLDKIKQVLQ